MEIYIVQGRGWNLDSAKYFARSHHKDSCVLPPISNECGMHPTMPPFAHLYRLDRRTSSDFRLKERTKPSTIDGSVASYQYRHREGNMPAPNSATRLLHY